MNSSEQIPEINPEGSERENRKLNERKKGTEWTYDARIGRKLIKVIKTLNFIPRALES